MALRHSHFPSGKGKSMRPAGRRSQVETRSSCAQLLIGCDCWARGQKVILYTFKGAVWSLRISWNSGVL
jgi:hypothetical protein